jgi:hypothetical protein
VAGAPGRAFAESTHRKPKWLVAVFTSAADANRPLKVRREAHTSVTRLRLGGLKPLQALLTATILAVIPYALLRGPINRLVRISGTQKTNGLTGS